MAWRLVRRERSTRRELGARLQAVEGERTKLQQRRNVELALEQTLEHAASEDEVIELVHRALVAIGPNRPVELHLVGHDEPSMRLMFATGAVADEQIDPTSPWDSIAARDGTTLVYPTTEVDDLCPHLRARIVEPCSAIAVPLLAMGRIVGVLYVTGPNGAEPSARLVETYEVIARAAAAHIATVRGFAPRSWSIDTHADDIEIDLDDTPTVIAELRRLGDRDHATDQIEERIATTVPFTVLLFDIDAFGLYQAQHGAPAGDEALRTVAEVATGALDRRARLYRLEADRLLAILDHATAHDALEQADHIRHALAHELLDRPEPRFTLSFGVVEASRGTSSERVLFAATDALYNARARGNDSIVLGLDRVLGTA